MLEVELKVNRQTIRTLRIVNQGTTSKRPIGSNKKALEAQQQWDRVGSQLCVYDWVADVDVGGTIVHLRDDGAERLARRALSEYVIQTRIGPIPK